MSETEKLCVEADQVALVCKLFQARVDHFQKNYAPSGKLITSLDALQVALLDLAGEVEDYAGKGREE